MKKSILTVLLFISILSYGNSKMLKEMLPYIAEIESISGILTTGDNGKAVGDLQIWKITVDDVNRVYKTKYTYQDRNSRKKSEEIFFKYLTFWGKQYTKKTCLQPTEEIYARIWNGGPKGYKKASTAKYWIKYKNAKAGIGYTLKSKRELMERIIKGRLTKKYV